MIIMLLLNSVRLCNNVCDLCLVSRCNVAHILFNCKSLEDRRVPLWQQVVQACPTGLAQELAHMDRDACTMLILNGLNCSYVREWNWTYMMLCKFVYIMYTDYCAATKVS